MSERVILRADEGVVLTDGEDYARVIYLAEDTDSAAYHQITETKYEAVLAAQSGEASG